MGYAFWWVGGGIGFSSTLFECVMKSTELNVSRRQGY
jgi:hypothetical protein